MPAPTRRTLAAFVVATSLAAPVAMSTAAHAAPDKNKPASTTTNTKQLVKVIGVKDAQLGRLATADRTVALADEVEAVLVANIAGDRAALAALRTEVEAVGSTLDAKAVRKELHDFRVVNYVLAGNILRQAEKTAGVLAGDAAAAAHFEEAVAAALTITAGSTKSEVRDARGLLRLAKGALGEDEAPAPAV